MQGMYYSSVYEGLPHYLEPLSVGQSRLHPGCKEDGHKGEERPGYQHENSVGQDKVGSHVRGSNLSVTHGRIVR